jgi:hypothetical protein
MILGSRIRRNSGVFVHFPKSGDFSYGASWIVHFPKSGDFSYGAIWND